MLATNYLNKKFDMIVATDLNWGIGYDNKLLVKVSQDMDFFKERTYGSVVVMGRKTSESLPNGYLKNRINIILSQSFNDKVFFHNIDGTTAIVHINSIEKLNEFIISQNLTRYKIIIVGGRSIYLEFLQRDLIDRVFLTTFLKKFKYVDTYIPDLYTLGFKYDIKNPNHIITGYEQPQKAIIDRKPSNMEFTIHTLTL